MGLVIIHTIGFIFGLGGATISDILFFKFLKDFKISKFESSVLDTLSKVIWAGLIILILSGIGLYLTDPALYNQSPKFLAKMAVVGVILINGTALNMFISPKLRKISFVETYDHAHRELRRLRRTAFALGAVSMVSWYSAFFLGSLRSLALGAFEILAIYFVLLAEAVITSQLVEYALSKRRIHF